MNFKKNWGLLTLTVGLSAMLTISCSKKKTSEESESTGDVTSIDTGDSGNGSGYGAAGQKIGALPTIYFEYDSFSLNSAAKEALGMAAQWLKTNASQKIQVEGHCDERGTTEYNLALGERRASSVRDYLTSQGVSAAQVSTISYGEERPAAMGSDEAAWAKNRRAEFVTGN